MSPGKKWSKGLEKKKNLQPNQPPEKAFEMDQKLIWLKDQEENKKTKKPKGLLFCRLMIMKKQRKKSIRKKDLFFFILRSLRLKDKSRKDFNEKLDAESFFFSCCSLSSPPLLLTVFLYLWVNREGLSAKSSHVSLKLIRTLSSESSLNWTNWLSTWKKSKTREKRDIYKEIVERESHAHLQTRVWTEMTGDVLLPWVTWSQLLLLSRESEAFFIFNWFRADFSCVSFFPFSSPVCFFVNCYLSFPLTPGRVNGRNDCN